MVVWLHAAMFFCCELAYEAGMPEDEWSCGCMLQYFFGNSCIRRHEFDNLKKTAPNYYYATPFPPVDSSKKGARGNANSANLILRAGFARAAFPSRRLV